MSSKKQTNVWIVNLSYALGRTTDESKTRNPTAAVSKSTLHPIRPTGVPGLLWFPQLRVSTVFPEWS